MGNDMIPKKSEDHLYPGSPSGSSFPVVYVPTHPPKSPAEEEEIRAATKRKDDIHAADMRDRKIAGDKVDCEKFIVWIKYYWGHILGIFIFGGIIEYFLSQLFIFR